MKNNFGVIVLNVYLVCVMAWMIVMLLVAIAHPFLKRLAACQIETQRRTMMDSKIRVIALFVVLSLLGTPVLSLAKAGSGYRGGRGSSQGDGMSANNVGSRGSRTFDQNGFKPIERSNASPGSSAGTSRAAGPGAPQTAAAPPVAQPSFFQRNPVLSGIAAGLAGSWIGHMLFGATSSLATTQEGAGPGSNHEDASSSGPSAGLLLLLMAVAVAGVYYIYKRRNGNLSPALTGFRNAGPVRSEPPAWVPPSVGVLSPLSSSEPRLTAADEEEFRRLLVEIQTAWSRQDISRLLRVATSEMCQYFSDKLAENVSRGVENRVEGVVVVDADVREVWAEGTRFYATVLLRWKARDYVQSLAKPSSELSDAGEAADRELSEFAEAWTFVKHQDGKWLLSAIQEMS